ncbi:MAG: T9SS type A sorting domain-containing protein, partial [Tannerella sp.]|nr:T9SS type A sorting domain-containing protein [Tannerella sp.]
KAIASTTCVLNSETQLFSAIPASNEQWRYDDKGRPAEYLKRTESVGTNILEDNKPLKAKEIRDTCDNKRLESKDIQDSEYFNVRILYSYSETGDIQEETYFKRVNNSWQEEGQYTYSFINSHQQIANSYYYSVGQWKQDGKTINDYNSDGDLMRTEFYGRFSAINPQAYCVYLYASEDANLAKSYVDDNYGLTDQKEAGFASLKVYPNPASDFVNITIHKNLTGKTLSLYDSSGKQVETFNIAGTTSRLDLSKLPDGVYFMKAGETSRKIIIKK